MQYKALNRADGVDGHYCVGRTRDGTYWEFWNEDEKLWCAAGTVCERGEADALVAFVEEIQAVNEEVQAARAVGGER